jgi:hypothetical protein
MFMDPAPTPEPHAQNKNKKIIFGAIIFIITGALIFYLGGVIFPSSSPKPNPSHMPTLEDMKSVVMNRTKLVFPEIISAQDVAKTALPQVITNLIPSDAQSIKAEEVKYKSTSGFRINFTVPRSFKNVRIAFDISAGADKINIGWTQLFGIVEMKKSNFQIRILLTSMGSSETQVSIQSIVVK